MATNVLDKRFRPSGPTVRESLHQLGRGTLDAEKIYRPWRKRRNVVTDYTTVDIHDDLIGYVINTVDGPIEVVGTNQAQPNYVDVLAHDGTLTVRPAALVRRHRAAL